MMKNKKNYFIKWAFCLLFAGLLSFCLSDSFTGSSEVQAATSNSANKRFTGWKTSSGKKYYYKNGKKLTDLHKIGKYYYCFDSNGVMMTGWNRIHNRFRYFGKQTGRMRISQTVNGRKINSKGVWTPVVVLDPGHSAVVASGYEPLGPGSSELKEKDTSGTEGVATHVEEYKLTLDIGLQLRTLLQKRGFKIVMTRTNSNVALSCIDRANVANKAKADAYIRLHANGSDSPYDNGAMTLCTTRNNPYTTSLYRKNKALSEAVLNSYVAFTGCRKEYIWETDTMTGNNWSKVPTTLIEMGYMSSPTEDYRMQQPSYQKKMVWGIAAGIEKYLTDF